MRKRALVPVLALAYFFTLAAFAHVGFVGPVLMGYAHAQGMHPMGKTSIITPGTIITLDNGTKYKIDGGVSTANPKGFVLDWSGPHGFYECQTPHKTPNGSCRDGIRLHYVNPTTGERQDALMNPPNDLIPIPAPTREGR